MVYKFFDNKSAKSSGINSILNQQLADKLHKPVLRKSKIRKFGNHLKTIFGVLM